MSKATYGQIKSLMEQFENARRLDASESIPANYIDRLRTAAELLKRYEHLKPVDWDNVDFTPEAIEHAEGAAALKAQLKTDMEKHFQACSMVVGAVEKKRGPGRRSAGMTGRYPVHKLIESALRDGDKTEKEILEYAKTKAAIAQGKTNADEIRKKLEIMRNNGTITLHAAKNKFAWAVPTASRKK